MIHKKNGTDHLYQTPKNIEVSQKNDKEKKPELNSVKNRFLPKPPSALK